MTEIQMYQALQLLGIGLGVIVTLTGITIFGKSIHDFVTGRSAALSPESAEQQARLQAAAEEPIEAPKRKRGRPRKNPVPTKA